MGNRTNSAGIGANTAGNDANSPGNGANSPGNGTNNKGIGTNTVGNVADSAGTGTDNVGNGADTAGNATNNAGIGANTVGNVADSAGTGIDTAANAINNTGITPDTAGNGADTHRNDTNNETTGNFLILINFKQMNNRQRAKKDSYDRLTSFNTNYATQLSAIDGYTAAQKAFDDAVTIIDKAGGKQEILSGNSPGLVLAEKENMTRLLLKLALKGAVKATQSGHAALAKELGISETFIVKATKVVALQRAQNIRNVLHANLAILTNIKAADISALDNAIATYDNLKDAPVRHIQHKKAHGTDQLPAAFAAADSAVKNMYWLVKSEWADTEPALVSEMELAKEILDTGLRRTSIAFTVTDASGTPVAGATLTNGKGKSCTSTADGLAMLETLRPGNHLFTATAVGHPVKHVPVKVEPGKEHVVEVRL